MYMLYGEPEKTLSHETATGDGLGSNPRFGMVRRAITSDGITIFADLENGSCTISASRGRCSNPGSTVCGWRQY
jgi:hypothetical protein